MARIHDFHFRRLPFHFSFIVSRLQVKARNLSHTVLNRDIFNTELIYTSHEITIKSLIIFKACCIIKYACRFFYEQRKHINPSEETVLKSYVMQYSNFRVIVIVCANILAFKQFLYSVNSSP